MLKYKQKILLLMLLIIVYTFIYSFLDNTHFEGINPVQDRLKEEHIEEKANELTGNYGKEFYENNVIVDKNEIEKTTEKEVEVEKRKIESPSITQHIFDRFYFSMITACLLGYGDIYPSTNVLKFIVSTQSFITLCLILY